MTSSTDDQRQQADDRPPGRPGRAEAPPAAEQLERQHRYDDAIKTFQDHCDRPGAVTDDELAAALVAYQQRWDNSIRSGAHRFGFTDDDTSTVAQKTLAEFFTTRIETGVFDPSRGHFAILKKLLQQRAIDHWRHLQTPGARPDREGLQRHDNEATDPFTRA